MENQITSFAGNIANLLSKKDKLVTIGVPAFRATDTICDLLSSVQIQTIRDHCEVVIQNDDPKDNKAYDFVLKRYPDLDITILPCEKNVGPGLARQGVLDYCKTEWITWIDADDVFTSPFALEWLVGGINSNNCIEVMAPFGQEVDLDNASKGNLPMRIMPVENPGHPWMFFRLYKVEFLKQFNIRFQEERSAMEDGCFNWKIRMITANTPLTVNILPTNFMGYLWRTGSEHSITRIGTKENDGMPLYNFDLCMVGSTVAAIDAVNFSKKINPFNGEIIRFAVEQMVGQYFTYIKCLAQRPMFAKQNLFNAKRFYHAVYKNYENDISDDILTQMYTMQMAGQSMEMIGFIPEISFFEFMEKVKTDDYGAEKEWYAIREEYPDWVNELGRKTGMMTGETGTYVYYDGEERGYTYEEYLKEKTQD